MTMEPWIVALCEELGVPIDDVDVNAILDLAKDAAHNVERPAAPVTTFIAGYAAAVKGGGSAAVDAVIDTATEMAAEWPEGGPASAQAANGAVPLDTGASDAADTAHGANNSPVVPGQPED